MGIKGRHFAFLRRIRNGAPPKPWDLLLRILALTAIAHTAAEFLRNRVLGQRGGVGLFETLYMAIVAMPFLYYLVVKPAVGAERRVAAERVNLSEAKYHALVEQSAEGIYLLDPTSHRILEVNDRLVQWLGYPREEITSLTVEDLLAPLFATGEGDWVDQVVREGVINDHPRLYRRAGGLLLEVEGSASLVTYAGQRVILVSLRDVSDLRRSQRRLLESEELLRRSEAKYRALVEQSAEGIYTFDPGTHRILEANHRLLEWLGYTREELTSMTIDDLIASQTATENQERLEQVLREGVLNDQARLYRRADGALLEVESSASLITYGDERVIQLNLRDVREIRRLYLAHYDVLTGLPNRQLFIDRLGQAVAQAKRARRLVAVMFLDLDRFKFVNDALGHQIGDVLLRSAAGRLTAAVRESDTVSRLSGDEFAILLGDLTEAQDAGLIAQKVLATLEEPFQVNGHEIFLTASAGITVYPLDSPDVEGLLRYADTAMFHAKEEGRNNYQFYTQALNAEVFERMSLESALRKALERNEFVLHYQPQVEIATGKVVGVEALLRWRHPELGMISPARFIPLAEESGLILAIGEWVLREACAQNMAWQQQGLPPMRVAVNLSARQFQQPGLEDKVARVLRETGLNAKCLELELTESLLMRDAPAAVRTLNRLRNMGIHVGVDDFGTGYSSLSYLKRFPIDRLKIDQSFVRDIGKDSDADSIAEAVIALAHSLRMRAVAEGVETGDQLEYLCSLNCDEVQGYYFGHPMPAESLPGFFKEFEKNRVKPRERVKNLHYR